MGVNQRDRPTEGREADRQLTELLDRKGQRSIVETAQLNADIHARGNVPNSVGVKAADFVAIIFNDDVASDEVNLHQIPGTSHIHHKGVTWIQGNFSPCCNLNTVLEQALQLTDVQVQNLFAVATVSVDLNAANAIVKVSAKAALESFIRILEIDFCIFISR